MITTHARMRAEILIDYYTDCFESVALTLTNDTCLAGHAAQLCREVSTSLTQILALTQNPNAPPPERLLT